MDMRKAGMLIVNIADTVLKAALTAKTVPSSCTSSSSSSILLPTPSTSYSTSMSMRTKKTRPLSLSAAKTVLQSTSSIVHREQSVSSILDDLRTLCCDSTASDRDRDKALDEGDSLTYSREGEGDENDPRSAVTQSPVSNHENMESISTKDLKSYQGSDYRGQSCPPVATVNPMDFTSTTVLRNHTTGVDTGSYEPYSRAPVQKVTAQSRRVPVCRGNTGPTVHPAVPETKNSEKILQLERVLNYIGGPSLLLYGGTMIVIACGSLLVLIDTQGTAGVVNADTPGLWRHFRSFLLGSGSVFFLGRKGSSDSNADEGEGEGEGEKDGGARDKERTRALVGCEQAFLRGHNASIGLLEV